MAGARSAGVSGAARSLTRPVNRCYLPSDADGSLRLTIDFGSEIGLKRSSAQLTVHYAPEQLVGRQIIAAVNIGTRRIAGFTSEVLVLGAMPSATEVVLLAVERPVVNGTLIG